MDLHIDWLSWTFDTDVEPITTSELYLFGRKRIKEVSNGHEAITFNGQSIEQAVSRAPYRLCLERADRGFRVFGASHTETLLYELTGRGCEGLRKYEDAAAFIAPLFDRITRVDYAVDIRTDVKPSVFANERSHRAFRSLSFIRSDTGETVYVGSPKSDRFCRVYRYNPPHPRADLLRVEFVFRRKLAAAAAQSMVETESSAQFMARLGVTYGWNHRVWQPDFVTEEKLKVPIFSRDEQKTVFWLYNQVAPAMKRLVAEGHLDITDFLQHVFDDPDASE